MFDDDVVCGATNVGLKRDNNQDQFLVAKLQKSMMVEQSSLPVDPSQRLFGNTQGHLMLVADGMGGHAAGEQASAMAIEFLVEQLLNKVHWFFRIHVDAENEFIDSLKMMLKETHKKIQAEGKKSTTLHGMGTTLTMTYMVWPKLYVLHAGDSRCYLIRDNEVEQLTTDHTLAKRLIDSGELKPADALKSRWSNVLWNVLGGKSDVELTAEVRNVILRENDTILLCSDGLHRYLNDAKIVELLAEHPTPGAAVAAFIQLALDAGADDNVTVVVAKPASPPDTASTLSEERKDLFHTTISYETINPADSRPQ